MQSSWHKELGKKTSHCFRVTCATRLFQLSVDERLIRERPGYIFINNFVAYVLYPDFPWDRNQNPLRAFHNDSLPAIKMYARDWFSWHLTLARELLMIFELLLLYLDEWRLEKRRSLTNQNASFISSFCAELKVHFHPWCIAHLGTLILNLIRVTRNYRILRSRLLSLFPKVILGILFILFILLL